MADGIRLVDHPTDPTKYAIQHYSDIEGQRVVVAEAWVERSLDFGGCMREGQRKMGEWLLASPTSLEPSLQPWIDELIAVVANDLKAIKARRLAVAMASKALAEEEQHQGQAEAAGVER